MTRGETALAEISARKQTLKNDLENFISRRVDEFQKSTNIRIESIEVQLHESNPVVELETNIDKIL